MTIVKQVIFFSTRKLLRKHARHWIGMAEKSDSSNQSQGEQNQKELDQICNELGEKQKGVDAKFADLDDKMVQMAKFFNTLNLFSSESEPEQELQKLKSLDLGGFAEYMKSAKKIVFMSGAGISTSAGIPDFRSPKTGLYANLQKYELPDPHLIFDLRYFKENPNPFFTLAKDLLPSNYKPTLVHYFQKLLVEKNMVHKIYSQNIDALESVANIPDEKIIYAHGSFKVGHCLSCRAEYPFEWIKRNIHEKQFLACESKQCLENKSKPYKLKVVKPDIVFFGEQMPEVFIGSYKSDMNECDCLIVMGTSLAVHPFGSLIDYVSPECPRLLINRDLVSDWLRLEADSDEKNTRDVAFQGNCDDGVAKLAELLGFKKDLFDLMTREEKRLGSEDKLSKTVPDKK